ncbi:hypothetical protein KJ969_02085 [Patescibacteria group bacterium]|nr:hypothetical protein [Patescibacteria group bacterium]MBU1921850.1 hypothetical protein [Patescibacteria group bacterium]
MPNEMTPEQQIMASELAMSQQAARRAQKEETQTQENAPEEAPPARPMPGQAMVSRVAQLTKARMQAKLAKAKTEEEAETRKAQMKRMVETVKKFKKLLRLGSAASVWGIIYLIASYYKDYIFGNLVNGDPTGLFSKKKSFLFVTPLSFPEVLLLLTFTFNIFVSWVATFWLPILVIAAIIFTVATVASGEWGMIKDIIDFLGVDVVKPILGAFGLSL